MNDQIITYNTIKNRWNRIVTNGDINPTPRIYHSVTLRKREKENSYIMHTVFSQIVTYLLIHIIYSVPNTNEIVLFGGFNDGMHK